MAQGPGRTEHFDSQRQIAVGKNGPNQLWVQLKDDVTESPIGGKFAEVKVKNADGATTTQKWHQIEWKPGRPRKGLWDMGHLDDRPYVLEHRKYMSSGGRYTPDAFKEWYQDPDNYQPKDPSRNRSREDDQY